MLNRYNIGRMSGMSDSDENQEQNAENTTLTDKEIKIRERREYVYDNMCKPPSTKQKIEVIAKIFDVDERTINRDKEWCREYRPQEWVSQLAKHGFLYNTMEYETQMKNNLIWLYVQRDAGGLEPLEMLAYQKEIASTLNSIVEVGSKHPFYEGIKKITEENEAKQ